MPKIKYLLPIIASLTISSCTTHFGLIKINNPKKEFNSEHINQSDKYIKSVRDFALDYYMLGGSVFSPLSIATCYSMLYDGALENSKKELEDMLHYDSSFDYLNEIKTMLLNNAINNKETKTILDINQSMWVHDEFKDHFSKDYANLMQDYYFAEAFGGDLESDQMHQALADYLNKKTNNFLNVKKEAFEKYGPVLWLTNTIYLKTKWMREFEEDKNTIGQFTNLDKSTKSITYMNRTTDTYYNYLIGEKCMISLLYLNDGITLTILLPDADSDYEQVLTNKENINKLLCFADYSSKEYLKANIQFQIPQMKVQQDYDLTKVLKELGVKDIFDPDKANLRGLIDKDKPYRNDLYVTQSRHEAGLELTNGGLEAAAYTIINVGPKSAAPIDDFVSFIVDHPFAYVVSNSDGLPLFMGRVNKL